MGMAKVRVKALDDQLTNDDRQAIIHSATPTKMIDQKYSFLFLSYIEHDNNYFH